MMGRGYNILFLFVFILTMVVLIVCGCIWMTIAPIALNVIDIESNLVPVDPYDIAHIESITDMNGSQWEFVVRVIDVETNTTVYDYCIYDVGSGSIWGSEYIEWKIKGGLKVLS